MFIAFTNEKDYEARWKDMFKRMIYNRLLEKGFNIYIYTYIYV